MDNYAINRKITSNDNAFCLIIDKKFESNFQCGTLYRYINTQYKITGTHISIGY